MESTIQPDGAFNNLPAEVLLEIIPHVPYTPLTLLRLRLTNAKIHALLTHHEHGLVSDIKSCQYAPATLALFPGLPHSYAGLTCLHERLQTLEHVHAQWLQIVNHGLELHWLQGRWEGVHKAGLLLLYRLQDAQSHEAKVELMRSLPASSLACLLFKLIASIKILRVLGPEPINARYAHDDVATRSDVELAFEELLLQYGPEFFVVLLKAGDSAPPPNIKAEWAVRTLEHEISNMESRQRSAKPATLISSLRCALAEKCECDVGQTVSKMWALLSSTGFDEVGDEMLGRIVRGEGVEGGLRRIW